MTPLPGLRRRNFSRFLFAAGLLLALFTIASWSVIDLAAQSPIKKAPPTEEEDPNAGKPKKRVPPEDEDPNPPKTKIPIPVDDDPTDKPVKPPPPPVAGDLAAAAKQTKHPGLRELFHKLSVPHDAVTFRSTGRVEYVEPLKGYYSGSNPQIKGTLPLKPLNRDDWKPLKASEAPQGSLLSVEPYELLALSALKDLEDKKYDRLQEGHKDYLSRAQILQASEAVLTAVVRFHEAAREDNRRFEGDWDSVISRVRAKLLDVQQEELAQVAATNNWDATYALARRFAENYSKPEDREKLARPLIEMAQQALPAENPSEAQWREGRRRFAMIDDAFPGSAVAGTFGARFRQRAENLFERAKKLQEQHDDKQALELIEMAEAIWPRLSGLHDMRLRLGNAYPILRVGVSELPASFLPGLAASDSEKQVVELLFEGLVQPARDGAGGQGYDPCLAGGPPKIVPLGRQFQFARNTLWSNDKPVTAKDVVHTVELLKDPAWPGYSPTCAELFDDAQQVGGDPLRVRLTLKRGLFDPLSWSTFKILPRELTTANISRYNAKPVGSGPYKLSESIVEDGRKTLVFVANPTYAGRPGKSTLPRIREIHIVQSDDPVKDFNNGNDKRAIDLFLGLSTDQAKALRGVNTLTVTEPMPNRRIYFLAVNQQRPALKNENLRRALGHAVNREKILNECFRGDLGKKVHHALNGPYPAGSWACDLNIGSFDRPDKAKDFADQAAQDGYKDMKFTLVFPKGDAQVAKAMALIHDQMKEIGIEIELKPLEPAELRETVEKTQSYDLAYYHYDYPSELYWLKPLFEQGGKLNYMNLPIDSELESLFGKELSHRQFSEMQRPAQSIHGIFQEKMPFVPLWQLDTVAAYHNSLKPGAIDPLLLFPGVEEWRIEKQ
jgi:peptide/nickel transport system substrate-binding protein